MIAAILTGLLAQVTPQPCWHPAHIIKQVQPIWPSSLSKGTPPFEVVVLVTVETDGTVQKAHIYKSGGYSDADAAAIVAAKATVYEAGVGFDCQPAPLDYLFRADFTPPK